MPGCCHETSNTTKQFNITVARENIKSYLQASIYSLKNIFTCCLFVGRVFSKWCQLEIGPVNQIENDIATRKKEAAHFIDKTGFILD